MKKLLILSALFMVFLISSCSSGSEDDNMMMPPNNNNNVTYTANIKSIIDTNCISCHQDPPINGAPMSLLTYQNVRDAVSGRGLINRVENGSMPPGPNDLSASQVQALKDWQANGFTE